jgi:uncharacterized protein YdeI (YjbR/CyaY-like superfamily)
VLKRSSQLLSKTVQRVQAEARTIQAYIGLFIHYAEESLEKIFNVRAGCR